MIYDIIKVGDYLYAIDSSQIGAGDYWQDKTGDIQHDGGERMIYHANKTGCKKIIASTDPFLNDIPLLPSPEGQDDAEQLALKHYPYKNYNGKRIGIDDSHTGEALRGAYCNGYEDAKSKGQYSEEDMYAMFQAGREFELNKDQRDSLIGAEEALEWLKPVPIGVEIIDGQFKRWIYEDTYDI